MSSLTGSDDSIILLIVAWNWISDGDSNRESVFVFFCNGDVEDWVREDLVRARGIPWKDQRCGLSSDGRTRNSPLLFFGRVFPIGHLPYQFVARRR